MTWSIEALHKVAVQIHENVPELEFDNGAIVCINEQGKVSIKDNSNVIFKVLFPNCDIDICPIENVLLYLNDKDGDIHFSSLLSPKQLAAIRLEYE